MSGGNSSGRNASPYGSGMVGGGSSMNGGLFSFASPQQMQQPALSTQQQQVQQPSYDAWDASAHYGTPGQMVSYGGNMYKSLGDMPNGQTGFGGGTWNENSRPDITPQLWQLMNQLQQPQQQPQQVAQNLGASFVGAAPQSWQLPAMKRGGLVDLVRKRK